MHVRHKQGWMFFALVSLFLVLFLSAAQADGAQVSGTVYYDRNSNGKQDGNEAGLANAKVVLEQRLTGGNKDLSSKAIDKNGTFAFAVNQEGEYRLRIELPKEYYFTIHGSGSDGLPSASTKSYTPYFVLSDGDALVQNIGATKYNASLSLVAFEDVNLNGGRSSNEPTLRNVVAELLYEFDGKTYVVMKSTSDKTGNLSMRNFSGGTYRLRVTLPDNYVIGPLGEKANTWYNRIKPAEQEGMGYSNTFTVEPGHTVSLGIGAVKTGSLTGSVWYDQNFNGTWDNSEAGLTDATVLLISPSLNLTWETKPDEEGHYSFKGLQPGDYKVGVQLPDGLVFTYPGASLITTIGSYGETAAHVEVEKTTQLGPVGAMPAATLRIGFCVDDNLDDCWDEGEPALAGVSVTAVQNGQTVETKLSGEDGFVTFSSLRSGEAEITCQLPEGYIFEIRERENLTVSTVTDKYTVTVPLTSENGENADWQGMLAVTVPGTIRGKLFEDPDNTGLYADGCAPLAGFTVQAVSEDGQVVAQAVTNDAGEYQLAPLYAGNYTVHFLLNDPYVASPHTEDNDILNQTPAFGETEKIAIVPGQEVNGVDGAVFRAGVVNGSVLNSLSDGGLRNITATLMDAEGKPVSDFSYGVTGDDGTFMIKGVLPGVYSVRYTLPQTTALTSPATDDKELTTDPFTMTSGAEIHLPQLQGVYTASLEGFVGQDGASPTVAADIALTAHASGETLTVSTEDGHYHFAGLRPGAYTLQITLPEGYVFGQLSASPFGPDANHIASAEISLNPEESQTIHVKASLPVDFSGVMYYDANRSASQDDDEAGAAERKLSLWMNGSKAADLTTDENGEFFAGHLVPGDYTLQIELASNEVIVGTNAQQQDHMWLIDVSLDADQMIAIPVMRYSAVTGSVWNLDGSTRLVQDIPVSLLDSNGNVLGIYNTNESGAFGFSKLLPGEYSLTAVLPEGYQFAREQDTASRPSYIQSQASGQSTSISFTVGMGKKLSGIDIGMGAMGKVGDKAWLDENGNGMQDIGEPGVPGIQIELYKNGEFVASATTDLYGRYALNDLYPGEYEMRVTMHGELKTTKRQAQYPLVASILPENSDSTVVTTVTVPSGGQNLHCDLGFQLKQSGVYPAVMNQTPTKNWLPYSER
ncbi:MAG: hypothetical protein IJ189_10550 [Clostridia bacterium]|nr:hypothetical protein [Clostridia bacterium]